MRCLKRGKTRLRSVQAGRGRTGEEGKDGRFGQRERPGSQRHGSNAGKYDDQRGGDGDLGNNMGCNAQGAIRMLAIGMGVGKFYSSCGNDQYNTQQRQEYLPWAACGRTESAIHHCTNCKPFSLTPYLPLLQDAMARWMGMKMDRKYSFEESLDRLAQVAVRVGLGIEPGQTPPQELLISTPIEAMPLVRRITEHAYKAGVTLVSPFIADDECILARYRYGRNESFDTTSVWMADALYAAFKGNAARIAIAGSNPALLADQDPEKIARANKVASQASKPAMEMITRHEINWAIVAAATPEWAALAFPNETPEAGMRKLWDAIFAASRVNTDDPVAAWKEHSENLKKRSKMLNEKSYASLKYRGPGTDFEVGLADDHKWLGGGGKAGNGIKCMQNIPTEEVFTTPHKDRIHGTVRSTKPLSHQGTLIKDIQVRFENGRIVDAKASTGQEAFQRLIDTDEGARRLGEVALVPHSSPISASGLLFFNTLFDENAASHIALGQAYSSCIRGGDELDEAHLAAKGANTSLIHVDWMIGSGEIDIDGITQSGTVEPLMRKGEWATAV